MHRDPNTFHCSCCLLDKNFRIFYRSLYVSAYLDRKISSFFFKYPISTCNSASLSIECCQRSLTDFELRDSKNEPAIFWPVGFLQISRDVKMRGHIQLFSWVKTINLRGNWDAKVCIFFIACGSCQLYPSLQSSSKIFQGPFWSSALFGQFLKLDHRHQPLRPYSYLQKKTSSINQLFSRQIFGWSIKRSAALSTSLSYTTFLAGVVS